MFDPSPLKKCNVFNGWSHIKYKIILGTFAVSCIESLIFSRSGIGEIGVGISKLKKISCDGNFGHAPISIGLSVSFSGFSGFSGFSEFSDCFEFGNSVGIFSGTLAGDEGLQGVPFLDTTFPYTGSSA